MNKNAVLLAVLALVLLWPAGTAWATAEGEDWSFDGGKTFVNEDVTVSAGQVLQGPLGLFDGDLTVEAEGRVVGDVFVSGGDAHIAGQITGGLAVMSGDTRLEAGSYVSGDVFGLDSDQDIAGRVGGNLTSVSGQVVLRSSAVIDGNLLGWREGIEREPGAQVKGQELQGIPSVPFLPAVPEPPRLLTPQVPSPMTPIPPVPVRPARPPRSWGQTTTGDVGRVFGATLSSLVLIAVGMLVVIIWRRPVQRVSNCIVALPWRSLGVGVLTVLIAVVVEVVAALLLAVLSVVGATLSATIILLPLGIVLILLGVLLLLPAPLALAAGLIVGWVGLAELLGRRVLGLLRVRDVSPLAAVVLGLALTILLPALLSLSDVCCIAWPAVVLLVSSLGLGSVVLTRFGTRTCFPARGPLAPPAAGQGEALPPEAMDAEAGLPDTRE